MTAKLKEARAAPANTKTANTELNERVLPGLGRLVEGELASSSTARWAASRAVVTWRLLNDFVTPMRSSPAIPASPSR
jgi:hypothetical protein